MVDYQEYITDRQPDKCPRCGDYKHITVYNGYVDGEYKFTIICDNCGLELKEYYSLIYSRTEYEF